MGLTYVPEWLKIVLIGWGAVSFVAAPIVGRFLAGALHENVREAPRDAPVYGDSLSQLARIAGEPIAAPDRRI
jgi:hypothetical protein